MGFKMGLFATVAPAHDEHSTPATDGSASLTRRVEEASVRYIASERASGVAMPSTHAILLK